MNNTFSNGNKIPTNEFQFIIEIETNISISIFPHYAKKLKCFN